MDTEFQRKLLLVLVIIDDLEVLFSLLVFECENLLDDLFLLNVAMNWCRFGMHALTLRE